MSTPPALQSQYATRSDERAGGRRWRTVSKVLYAYYRRDMQDARDEQERLYPSNHDKHVARTVPFVYRVARELATLYLKTPARRFLRKRDDRRRPGHDRAPARPGGHDRDGQPGDPSLAYARGERYQARHASAS